VVGGATGGVAGAATGAALGSLGGPIGTIIGGLAGAVGGWWSGRAISEAASTFNDEDDAFYRSHYESSTSGGTSSRSSYDDTRPAYQLGHLAGVNPDYRNRSFDEVEPHLQTAYTSAGHKNWSDVRSHARDAYSRGREIGDQRLTLAEEELRIGKRQVQAGEVALHKTVETEHVRESVPLVREEVTIERRPVTGMDASTNVQISEDEIRIPVMAEEAVVDKRTVAKEEVVVRKEAKTENQTVEADLRRERLDVDRDVDTTRSTASGTGLAGSERGLSGAADRATNSGPLDRLADKADDLKDRVDGNPASRPGPDATDRRI
jgi:uncharacterized protein (TIGR02271 family)